MSRCPRHGGLGAANLSLDLRHPGDGLAADSRRRLKGRWTPRPARAALRLLSFLILGYILPTMMIALEVIPFSLRFHPLIVVTFGMALYAGWRRYYLVELGFRRDNLLSSLAWNIGVATIVFVVILLAISQGLVRRLQFPNWTAFYVFYVFISSPSQEFLFRGVMFVELKAIGLTRLIPQVLVSSLAYCFLHVIYRDGITLVVTAIMGIIWGTVYFKHPNILSISVSHALLGSASIALGLV